MIHSGMILAAPQSGSGKTTITCALLAAMKNRKLAVRSFKSGPDYIDPMFHRKILGVPSRNLDTFFSEEEQIRQLYAYGKEAFSYSVIEGAMGLYDGLGGTRKEGSAYHLAQILDLPVVLVLDARGMGRTMAALLAGMLQYDCDHRIIGVLLNRTSERFCQTMKPVIEQELGLPVFGCFPQQKELKLESRHLGLKLPEEVEGLCRQVKRAAEVLEESADLKRLLQSVDGWARMHDDRAEKETQSGHWNAEGADSVIFAPKPVIAVAKDPAFCFYYEDNLRLLQEYGGKLIYFSPLNDKQIPEEADAILLGGGYPELCAKQLSKNNTMRESIRNAIESGLPSVAECGGFMYLHETLTDAEGQTYPMAGVVRGGCFNRGKLTRFGYVTVEEQTCHFLAEKPIRAHEFHYYDSENNGQDCLAKKPVSNAGWQCIHEDKNHWWGYPHLYYPSNPAFVEHFVEEARSYHNRRTQSEYKNRR